VYDMFKGVTKMEYNEELRPNFKKIINE